MEILRTLCSRWDLVLDFDIDTDWRMDQVQPFNDRNPPETIGAPLPPRYALKLHRQIRRYAPLYEQAELARQAAMHKRKSDNGLQQSISPYRIRPASTSLLTRPDSGRSFNSSTSSSSFSSASTSIGSSISTSHGSEITFKPIDLPQDASESLRLLAAREATGSSSRSLRDRDGAPASGADPGSRESTGNSFGSKSKASLSDSALDSSRSKKSRARTKKTARSILTLTVLNVIEGSDSDDGSDHDQSDDDDSSGTLDHRWLVVPNIDLLQGGDNEDSKDEGSSSISSFGTDTGSESSPWSAETPPPYTRGVDSQKTRLYSLRKAFFAVLSSLLKGYREFIKTEERLRAGTDLQGAADASSSSPSKAAAPVEAPMPKNFLANLTSSMRRGALGEAVDKPSAYEFAEEYAMEEVFDAAGFVAMREASSAEDWHLKHFLTIFLKQVKLICSL